MSEMDLFDQMAAEPQEEQQPFEELPADAWVLMKTATKDNGGAAPLVRADEDKKKTNADGTPVVYRKFNVGLYTLGGDAKILDRHRNKSVFLNCFILPGEEELKRNPSALLGGRVVGVLNTLFATGVATEEKDAKVRSAARWTHTMGLLKGVLAEHPECTLDQYEGSKGRLIAGVAVLALQDQSRLILVKTKKYSYESRDGEKKSRIEPGTFEDATTENIEKRKVRVLEGAEAEAVAPPSTEF